MTDLCILSDRGIARKDNKVLPRSDWVSE